jgi:hypothetical protein
MAAEDFRQELDVQPFERLRLQLATKARIDIQYAGTEWVCQNTFLVVPPLTRNTSVIGGYDVVTLSLIERIARMPESSAALRIHCN